MSTLHIHIVTPEATVFRGEASDITLSGWEGEFQVLAGHDRVLSLLRGGGVRLLAEGVEHRFAVGRGFAEVVGDQVAVLVDSAVRAAEVDRAAMEADLVAVSEALHSAGEEAMDGLMARREVAEARLRLL